MTKKINGMSPAAQNTNAELHQKILDVSEFTVNINFSREIAHTHEQTQRIDESRRMMNVWSQEQEQKTKL